MSQDSLQQCSTLCLWPPRPPILTLAARGGLGAEPGGGAGLSQGVIRPRRASPPRRLIRPEEVAL